MPLLRKRSSGIALFSVNSGLGSLRDRGRHWRRYCGLDCAALLFVKVSFVKVSFVALLFVIYRQR